MRPRTKKTLTLNPKPLNGLFEAQDQYVAHEGSHALCSSVSSEGVGVSSLGFRVEGAWFRAEDGGTCSGMSGSSMG